MKYVHSLPKKSYYFDLVDAIVRYILKGPQICKKGKKIDNTGDPWPTVILVTEEYHN